MFKKKVSPAKFLSPVQNFSEEEQPIEYRKDPLMERWCRINVKRTERVKQVQCGVDFLGLIESSKAKCYFCPQNVEKDTPLFLPQIVPEGRIRLGETWIFPNLFPFSQYHAVATFCEKHFPDLNEFTEKQIEDTFAASIKYFEKVYNHDKKAKHALFNWNNLPPSGASIIHPHAQLTVDNTPTYLTDAYLKASKKYYKKNHENYWEKLVKEEKKGDRFVGTVGDVSWFTSFAPLGNNEVNAIFEGKSNFLELDTKDISAFARGLKKILMGYYKLCIKSFNLTTYSAPMGEEMEWFWLNAKIISRPVPQGYYTADAGFMELMHRERVVESMPEKVAEILKQEFK